MARKRNKRKGTKEMQLENLQPINGNILVRDAAVVGKTKSGIVIPENISPNHIVNGTVVSVSKPWIDKNGNNNKIEDFKEGDNIIYGFNAGAGNSWDIDGVIYRVLKSVEILAVTVE
jgi:co-chaperonin GroES (HSP10)